MRKLISIFFTLILLTFNSGLLFASHTCGGHYSEHAIVYGSGDIGCGMEMPESDDHSDMDKFSKTPCCENLSTSLEIENSFTTSIDSSIPVFEFVPLIESTLFDSLIPKDLQIEQIPQPVPLLESDILVLIQSFRI